MTDLESPDPAAESPHAISEESEGHYTSADTDHTQRTEPGTYVSTDWAGSTEDDGAADAPPEHPMPS